MNFLTPPWLWALPLVVLLGFCCWRYVGREFRRRIALFVAAKLRGAELGEPALARKRRGLMLGFTALALIALALARPLAGLKSGSARQQGVNVMIAVDGSRSMQVADVEGAADRFALAQHGIDTLLQSFDGDRAGLVLFGSQATLIAPVTFDTVSLQVMARGLTPELVGRGGSNLATVIQRASAAFDRKDYNSKVLLILSDGEETEGDAVIAASEAYRKQGLRIFTFGVGSATGAPIPRYERDEDRNWVQLGNVTDPSGREVTSRLDSDVLAAVAAAGGGRYFALSGAKLNLRDWYVQNLQPLAGPLEETELSDLHDWFQVPLGIALALLGLEMILRRPAGTNGKKGRGGFPDA